MERQEWVDRFVSEAEKYGRRAERFFRAGGVPGCRFRCGSARDAANEFLDTPLTIDDRLISTDEKLRWNPEQQVEEIMSEEAAYSPDF